MIIYNSTIHISINLSEPLNECLVEILCIICFHLKIHLISKEYYLSYFETDLERKKSEKRKW